MKPENHFKFINSNALNNVALLSATMSDFAYSRHAHEEYSIGVTMKGRQDFFCGQRFHKSPSGSVLVFNPEDIHDGHAGDNQGLEYIMLYIHPKILTPLFQSMGHIGDHELRFNDVLFDAPTLRHHIWTMASLVQSKQVSHIEYESALYMLAQSLIQHQGSFEPAYKKTRTDTLLMKAKSYIHDHLCHDISVDDISLAANMSKYHFIRLFRAQFGITPHQYVLNCRINLARQVMQDGFSATHAAMASGFADVSHLNRNFKKVFGMTPKQFQLQWSTL